MNISRMVEDIERLYAKNIEPTEAQVDWYMTRQDVISIVKPKYVSTLLLEPCSRFLQPKADDDFIDVALGRILKNDKLTGESVYDL